jgi:hypothetical protein
MDDQRRAGKACPTNSGIRKKELGGWETLERVKYAYLVPSHIADYANTVKLWSRLSETKTNASRPPTATLSVNPSSNFLLFSPLHSAIALLLTRRLT